MCKGKFSDSSQQPTMDKPTNDTMATTRPALRSFVLESANIAACATQPAWQPCITAHLLIQLPGICVHMSLMNQNLRCFLGM